MYRKVGLSTQNKRSNNVKSLLRKWVIARKEFTGNAIPTIRPIVNVYFIIITIVVDFQVDQF